MSYILGMDTIIYFYQKRNPVQREISLMYQEDYLFAKVGICADRHSWFGCPIPHAPAPPQSMQDASLSVTKSDASLPVTKSRELQMQDGTSGETQTAEKYRESWFGRRRKMRERQRELRRQQQEYMQKLQEYKERQEELAASMRQLWKEVFSEVELAGGAGEVRCVYEDSLRFLAEGQGEAAICWSPVWNIPEFQDYKSMRWLRPLLEYVRHSDFILLGTADCIPAILQEFARRMKSLQWYLREEDLSEELQGWVEDFYEEYGLAITLRELKGGNAFGKLRLKSGEPVCVMDFTDEEKLFAGNLAGGSIWLDFASVDGKFRRMERQAPEVSYMSLKKYWGAKTKMKPNIPKCHTASRFRLS
ncbi:MAG: hypothetical protein K2K63_07100 [Acetatifactor sp.]|nr:hypothetical protein [Acetatifactor sp.]